MEMKKQVLSFKEFLLEAEDASASDIIKVPFKLYSANNKKEMDFEYSYGKGAKEISVYGIGDDKKAKYFATLKVENNKVIGLEKSKNVNTSFGSLTARKLTPQMALEDLCKKSGLTIDNDKLREEFFSNYISNYSEKIKEKLEIDKFADGLKPGSYDVDLNYDEEGNPKSLLVSSISARYNDQGTLVINVDNSNTNNKVLSIEKWNTEGSNYKAEIKKELKKYLEKSDLLKYLKPSQKY
jgi:hypothetical protein